MTKSNWSNLLRSNLILSNLIKIEKELTCSSWLLANSVLTFHFVSFHPMYYSSCLPQADQLMFAMHFVKGMYPELFQENVSWLLFSHISKTIFHLKKSTTAVLLLQEWDMFTGSIVGEMFKKEVRRFFYFRFVLKNPALHLFWIFRLRSSLPGLIRSVMERWQFLK